MLRLKAKNVMSSHDRICNIYAADADDCMGCEFKAKCISRKDGKRRYLTVRIETVLGKYIQNQLGHSNPTVTLNVYAHLMKPTNQEAACRLEKAIF